jgi:hypothetical protein
MHECIRCRELIDGDYECCAACSFETDAPSVWGVRVGRQWLTSWDAANRAGALGPQYAAHRFGEFMAALNAAHYLGGRAVALDAVAAPSLFE